MPTAHRSRRASAGFTLIELMMTVAIAAILASVAIPMYRDYVLRSRIIDATSKLSDFRVRMEQYFMDNRTYADGANCGVPNPTDTGDAVFTIECKDAGPAAYTVTASGKAAKGMSDFAYTIVASGAKETTKLPGDWTDTAGCWVTRKDGKLLTMAERARPAEQRGLSLIELMVAVAVAIILSLMAMPVYQVWVANQQVRTATESLLDGIRIAQGEAVKRNQPVRMVFDNGDGWNVELVSDDSVLRTATRREGSTQVKLVVTPLGADSVVFDGLGRVLDKDLAPLDERITIDFDTSTTLGGVRALRVVIDTVAATGFGIRSCDPKLGAGDPRACPA